VSTLDPPEPWELEMAHENTEGAAGLAFDQHIIGRGIADFYLPAY
jgi:hypothetical protein